MGSYMNFLPTGREMAELDRHTIENIGIPSSVLMERAALAVRMEIDKRLLEKYKYAHRTKRQQKLLIVCGNGNNGADGIALARMYMQSGADVSLVLPGGRVGRSVMLECQLDIFRKIACEYGDVSVQRLFECEEDVISEAFVDDLVEACCMKEGGLKENTINERSYDIVVDAVFGVGLNRDVSGAYSKLFDHMNACRGLHVAVDIPSGVCSETGHILGSAFRADLTVTFEVCKKGMVLYPGASACGEIVVSSIGISTRPLEKKNHVAWTGSVYALSAMLPVRRADTNKGDHGKVLLVCGSKEMPGAVCLAAMGAYRAGAGYVRVFTHASNRAIIHQCMPEILLSTYDDQDDTADMLSELLKWCDVVCVGSGLGRSRQAEQLVSYIMRHAACPVVLDGDGLFFAGEWRKYNPDFWKTCIRVHRDIICTPHIVEMARLSGESVSSIKADPVGAAKIIAEESKNMIVVVKDARTVVMQADRHPFIHLGGTPALAKAGSGDVLTGVIGALAAAGTDAYNSAVLGVSLHGEAGVRVCRKLGEYAVLATDTAREVGRLMGELYRDFSKENVQ